MTGRKITALQLNIWITTALIGPIIYYSKGNWSTVFLWGTALSVLVWITMRFGQHWDGTIYNVVQFLWLSVLLSQLLPYSADCWPTGERTFPVVPLVLLALATVTAVKGSKCAASGVSVLFWVISFLLGIVVVAGIPEIDSAFLLLDKGTISAPMMLVFLLPAAAGFLPCERIGRLPFITTVVIGSVVAIWISGILSPEIANAEQWPLYEAAKSVQLFDIAKRLESLVSAGVTVGNYALYSLLLCSVRSIGERFKKVRETVVGAACIASILLLFEVEIDPVISVIVCLILWVLLPILGALNGKKIV